MRREGGGDRTGGVDRGKTAKILGCNIWEIDK